MSDFKSKLPNFQEIIDISSKFLKDMKHSVCEIVQDYKEKHSNIEPSSDTKNAESISADESSSSANDSSNTNASSSTKATNPDKTTKAQKKKTPDDN